MNKNWILYVIIFSEAHFMNTFDYNRSHSKLSSNLIGSDIKLLLIFLFFYKKIENKN